MWDTCRTSGALHLGESFTQRLPFGFAQGRRAGLTYVTPTAFTNPCAEYPALRIPIPGSYSYTKKSFQYYRILLTNSYLSETMCYVRAGIGFSTLPALLGRKLSSVKSRVSITSKLIENKRLQVLYSGHLRKTGGGGVTNFAAPQLQIGLYIGKCGESRCMDFRMRSFGYLRFWESDVYSSFHEFHRSPQTGPHRIASG